MQLTNHNFIFEERTHIFYMAKAYSPKENLTFKIAKILGPVTVNN